jgi:DNA polymerase III subunit epsilon
MRTWQSRNSVPADVAARPWRAASWTVIDVETTGLNLDDDQIIAVGVVVIRRGLIDHGESYYSLIRPTCPLNEQSTMIHNLTATELADAPTAIDVGSALAGRLADTIGVAHAAWIERAFLDRLSYASHQDLPVPLIDTAALSRALQLSDTTPGYEPSLEHLARSLGLPIYTPHHALGDAMTTAVLFLALVARLEQRHGGTSLTVGELTGFSSRHRI